MPSAHVPMDPCRATRTIVLELEAYLRRTRIRQVYFADSSTAPPALAYVTHFPRLSLPLSGRHRMQVARNGHDLTITPSRGHAVFVPEQAWNKPDWENPVEVLTFLFGVKQIGISLVRHTGGTAVPLATAKTSVHDAYDSLTRSIMTALLGLMNDPGSGPLPALLTESLLHSCLRRLKSPPQGLPRKGVRTYESLCSYVQEHFQSPITRESVAKHFALAPNHLSRLFRKEGFIRFNEYLNLVRVNRAKFMLVNYNLTLKEIAAACGYRDVGYFCRVFRRACKMTPTEYRAGGAIQSVPQGRSRRPSRIHLPALSASRGGPRIHGERKR